MWNLLLGYLVTRALVGDRAVRTGVLVVLVSVGLLFLVLGVSYFGSFTNSFLVSVERWSP